MLPWQLLRILHVGKIYSFCQQAEGFLRACISSYTLYFSPSQRRGTPSWVLARREGINFARLLHPAKGKHYRCWKWVSYGGTSSLITKIWLFGRSEIINFQKHIFGKSFDTMRFQAIFVWRNEKNLLICEIEKYNVSFL